MSGNIGNERPRNILIIPAMRTTYNLLCHSPNFYTIGNPSNRMMIAVFFYTRRPKKKKGLFETSHYGGKCDTQLCYPITSSVPLNYMYAKTNLTLSLFRTFLRATKLSLKITIHVALFY